MADEKVTQEIVIEALKQVFDPEIPVNVYDLGFIYNIDIKAEGKIHILMTLTVPGCPIYQIIMNNIRDKVLEIDGINDVEVELTFEPRWSIEKITDAGKERLRELGYNV